MTEHPLYETSPALQATRATWTRFFASLNLPEAYRLSGPFTPDRASYYLALARMPAWQRKAELLAARDQALEEDNWRLAEDLNVSLASLDELGVEAPPLA